MYYQLIIWQFLAAVLLRPRFYFGGFGIDGIKGANTIKSPNEFLCVSIVFVNINQTVTNAPEPGIVSDIPLLVIAAEFFPYTGAIFAGINARPRSFPAVPSLFHAIGSIFFSIGI
ncbi:hypothetical protein D3C87_1632570 [compost metagenome]